jgi:hypothetical protein
MAGLIPVTMTPSYDQLVRTRVELEPPAVGWQHFESIDIIREHATSSACAMRTGRRYVAYLLAVVLLLLAPLAWTCLPDETSLGGLWDGADDDDAILHAQSSMATVDTFTLCRTEPVLVVIGFTCPFADTAAIPLVASAYQTRAPPAL